MNFKRTSPFPNWRQWLAVTLSVTLVPLAQVDLYAQAPSTYVELNAPQLDQLVAPVALYPDSLVASILTASTYPDQISAANAWLVQNMNLSPDQRAAGADAQPWDPSVKALIPFPQVLDNLARNAAWTSQLGNAYFNQPGDVENAVQAMRLQARQSGRLVATPQQRVIETNGVIEIAPVNPEVVYVPYYNPWAVWGGFVTPWPGWYGVVAPPGVVIGAGIAFGVGIGLGIYGGYGWGFHRWSPGWGGGGVVFGGRPYVSRSVTVYNHGNFGGHDRGVFEHGGRGVPGGFHGVARMGAARAAAERAGVRGGSPRFEGRGAAGAGRSSFAGNRGANAAAARAGARAGAAAGARSGAAAGARTGARTGAVSGARTGARTGAATGARTGARTGAASGARSGAVGGARAGGASGARAGGGARPSAAARPSGVGGRPSGGGGRPSGGGGHPAGGGGHPAGGGGGGGHHK